MINRTVRSPAKAQSDRHRIRHRYFDVVTRVALGVVVGITAVACPAGAQEMPSNAPLAITNVNVIDVRSGRVDRDRTVVLRDGRIDAIEAAGASIDGLRVLNGGGGYLIPGLWDMHVHISSPVAPALLFPQFTAWGVTGVRDMATDCGGDADEDDHCIEDVRVWGDQIEAGELMGPRLLALSTEPLNPPWDYEATEEEARQLVDLFVERGVDIIKVYYRMQPQTFEWLMDAANDRGLKVGGHIPIRLTATEASNLGLHSLEHARDFLFDCFPGSADFRATTMSQNPPLDVLRSMVDDHDVEQCNGIFETFIENETWYVPTHVTRRMDAFADDETFRNDPRQKYLPSFAWESWQRDADNMVSLAPSAEGRRIMRGFYTEGLAITGRAHDAGVNIVLGTDAGDTYVFPGSGVHDELGEFVKAGLTPAEALEAATWRSAEFLNLTEDYGTVEVGKVADLVLLRENPLDDIDRTRDIQAVIQGGRVWDRDALDALLVEIEARVANFSP